MLINADHPYPGNRPGAAAVTRSAVAPIAIVFTVCQDTPSSTAIAEAVVRSIINRRNTYRVYRRAVADRGAASSRRSWLNSTRSQYRDRGPPQLNDTTQAADIRQARISSAGRTNPPRDAHVVALLSLTFSSRSLYAGSVEAEQRGQPVGFLAERTRVGHFEFLPKRPQSIFVHNGCEVLIDNVVVVIGQNARCRVDAGDGD